MSKSVSLKQEVSLIALNFKIDHTALWDRIGAIMERRIEQAIVDTINEVEDVENIVIDDPASIISKVKKQVDQDNGKN